MRFWEVIQALTIDPEREFTLGDSDWTEKIAVENGCLKYSSWYKGAQVKLTGGLNKAVDLYEDNWHELKPHRQPDMWSTLNTNPPSVEGFIDYKQMAHEAAMEHIKNRIGKEANTVEEYSDVYFRILSRLEE